VATPLSTNRAGVEAADVNALDIAGRLRILKNISKEWALWKPNGVKS
jgi:hypothetical protein